MQTNPPVSRLSPQQLETYRREGFIIFDQNVFAPEKFERLKNHFEHRMTMLDPSFRPEHLDVPHFTDPALFEWLFADEVLDLIEPIIGPNIALWSSGFISKPKGDGKRVPWHEDSAYWKGYLDPMEVVTLWLAVDASTPENGCMRVVPRTHDDGFSDYVPVDTSKNVFPTEIRRIERFDRMSVPCVLEENQASLHHGKLIHGSPPNTSQKRRCGYTMRFIPTSVKFNAEKMAGMHQIYLARGVDLAGNSYADSTKSYDDLDFVRRTSGKKLH